MAILESNPTSILAFLMMILSGVYPNVTSFSCSNGGEIFSVSGNLHESYKQQNFAKNENAKNVLEPFGLLRLWHLQFRQFLQDLDLGLRLRRSVRIVPPSIDERLKMGAVLHLRLIFFTLIIVSFGFRRLSNIIKVC